jgi:2-dehydro-3-deoxyphosphogluconate aldolase / (4S)-4-hydroxy-2-oxoglutarate aldolase
VLVPTLQACRVLPVVTATDVESTVQLARALRRGGMTAIEITLRTPAALDSIHAVRDQVPGMLVAAGTVTNEAELDKVLAAGVELALSPGSSASLLRAAAAADIDFVPGVATASEVMQGMDHGFGVFKLFPAEALGGLTMLKSLAGPFPHIRFCPTGGLTAANFLDYLALSNVICCGGSWMVGANLVDNGKWDVIEALARKTMVTNQFSKEISR